MQDLTYNLHQFSAHKTNCMFFLRPNHLMIFNAKFLQRLASVLCPQTYCKTLQALATDLLMNFNTQFLHTDLHQFSISVLCAQTYCNSLQAFRPDLLKHSAQRPTSVLYIKKIQYTIIAHRPASVLYISSHHTNLL